jgi:fibronectin-binding autotransporter adhesin
MSTKLFKLGFVALAVGVLPNLAGADPFTTPFTVDPGSSPLVATGAISGSGALTISAGGSATLSAFNTYTGSTIIAPGGQLRIAGAGSIIWSSGVLDNGLLDVSQAQSSVAAPQGTAISSLAGNGNVSLGSANLTVSNPNVEFIRTGSGGYITTPIGFTRVASPVGDFYGSISDGGSGGSLTVGYGAVETLHGVISYTGATATGWGGILALAGTSSIAASSGLINNGTFDISGTNNGTSIASLSGISTQANIFPFLNSQGMSTGTFGGGGGDMLGSDGLIVTAFQQGTVALGGNTLTLTAAGSYAGTITDGGLAGGSGGRLTIASGLEILSGVNIYTGATTINSGAVLALADSGINTTILQTGPYVFGGPGIGSIASSSMVIVNGTFDISGTAAIVKTPIGGSPISFGGGATITGLAGSGAVYLGAQVLTISNASSSFSGVLADGGLSSGTGGALTIAGGTQTLAGINRYTGATTINSDAALVLAGSGSIAASSGVVANGLFDISGVSAGAAIASLSGSGQVNLGAQALTLTRAAGSFAGRITDGGAGGRLIIASGRQVLSGSNSYGGGTLITGGATLAVTSDAALGAPSGGITLANGTLQALGNLVTTRAITVNGSGTVDANGYQVALDGTLTVNGSFTTLGAVNLAGAAQFSDTFTANGPLSVNGTFSTPSLLIASTGMLRGTGMVSAPTTVLGRLAPGNSPGTLTFTGPVTLAPGSTTEIDIDGPGTGTGGGNYSRVIVTGPGGISLNGQLLPLLRGITGSATNSYTPPIGQDFTVIAAPNGGISGFYSSVTQPVGLAAGTRLDTLYAPTTVSLVVTPTLYGNLGLAGIGETPNQTALGAVLDAQRPAAGVPMNAAQAALYASLYSLSATALPFALTQLAPTAYGDALMLQRDGWYLVSSAIDDQLAARRGARPVGDVQSAPGPGGSTVWTSGLGRFAMVKSADAPGYGGTIAGVAAGIDTTPLPGLTAGVAFGFTSGDNSEKTGAGITSDAFQAELYAGLTRGIMFLDAQAGGMGFEGRVTRTLSAYGQQQQGDIDGAAGGGSVRGGVRLALAGWQMEPSLALGAVGIQMNQSNETLGNAERLAVAASSIASVQSLLGLRLERRVALNDGMTLQPSLRVGWTHEFDATSARTSATLATAPANPFTVQSAPIGREAMILGAAATLETGTALALYASYGGAFNGRGAAQTLSGGLRLSW